MRESMSQSEPFVPSRRSAGRPTGEASYRGAVDSRITTPRREPMAGWTPTLSPHGGLGLLGALAAFAALPMLVALCLGAREPLVVGAAFASGLGVLLVLVALNQRARGKPFLPHPGHIPSDLRPALDREGSVLVDEGVSGSVRFANFRAPGRRYLRRRNAFVGSIVLTQARIAAYASYRPILDVPLDDPRMHALAFWIEGDDVLCVSFDAQNFDAAQSGRIEYRFETPLAADFLDELRSR